MHGTDGKPDSNWFPWLKGKLEAAGYEVWAPRLPDAHVPNWQVWNDFILGSEFDLNDAILVGHSAGAVEILNLLSDERMPHIRLGVLVSGWESGPALQMDPAQFDYLFPPAGYDYAKSKAKADNLAMFHGQDDPYVPVDWARSLAGKLSVKLHEVPDGKHLGSNLDEFPELWRLIDTLL